MTTLYLIRHGITADNIRGVFQGNLNTPLNEQGLAQAACLTQRFAEVPLDLVMTSPLERAVQTAKAVKGHKKIPFLIHKGLIELHGGQLEGQTTGYMHEHFPEVMYNFEHHPARFDPPDGESCRHAYDRMVKTIRKIVARNKGRRIACVSHGMAIQAFLSYASGEPFEDMQFRILPNTAVCKFNFDSRGQLSTEYLSDDSHLPEELKIRFTTHSADEELSGK